MTDLGYEVPRAHIQGLQGATGTENEQEHQRTSHGQVPWVISPNTEQSRSPWDTRPQGLVSLTRAAETHLLAHQRKC